MLNIESECLPPTGSPNERPEKPSFCFSNMVWWEKPTLSTGLASAQIRVLAHTCHVTLRESLHLLTPGVYSYVTLEKSYLPGRSCWAWEFEFKVLLLISWGCFLMKIQFVHQRLTPCLSKAQWVALSPNRNFCFTSPLPWHWTRNAVIFLFFFTPGSVGWGMVCSSALEGCFGCDHLFFIFCLEGSDKYPRYEF